MPARRQGITLVETTVVIAIITILVSLTLVAVQSARESSRRIKCQNNLHQIGIAITNFTQSTRAFPSLFANRGTKGDAAFDQSAFVTILPELEVIFTKSDPHYPKDDPKNLPPPILLCPSGNELLGYRYSYGSGVRTLVFVLFADGHVTWVSKNMDVSAWRSLGTVAGHEPMSDTP